VTAAKVIADVASIERFRSERNSPCSPASPRATPHWASGCAHGLNSKSNRQLNLALHRIAITYSASRHRPESLGPPRSRRPNLESVAPGA
jgi:hypothetical protein